MRANGSEADFRKLVQIGEVKRIEEGGMGVGGEDGWRSRRSGTESNGKR